MKRSILLAGVTLLGTVAAAHSMDESEAGSFNWSGFYVGASLGHAGHDTTFDDIDYYWHGSSLHLLSSGLSYGLQAGYNWQSGALVYGVEADITDFTNRQHYQSYVYMHFRSDPNWVISLRGRAGLGVDRTLLYGTLGLAVADFDHSVTSDFTPSDSWNGLDATKAGVIGGFGIEHAFTDRFSARFEGLLAHFGKNGHHNVGGRLMRTGDTIGMARFGINYHFGQPAGSGSTPSYGSPADFSGFYAGGTLGGSLANISQTDINWNWHGGTLEDESAGFSGGLHVGYNWQEAARLHGIEIDLSLFSNRRHSLYNAADNGALTTGVDWMASVRARTGLVAGNSLFYLTGGVAFARFDNVFHDGYEDTIFDLSGTETGLIVGAGIEHMFTDRLTGRVEGTYAGFEGPVRDNGYGEDMRGHAHVVSIRAGVSYLFGERQGTGSGIAAPEHDWSGFYAGADISGMYHIGSITDRTYRDFGGTHTLPSLGGGLGGHVGYNWQRGSFVYGALADFAFASSSAEDYDEHYSRRFHTGANWMATLRARAGIASGKSYLYGTGGVALAKFDQFSGYDYEATNELGGTRAGWVVGLGVEQAINDRLSWKLEGLYSTFARKSFDNGVNICSGTSSGVCEVDGHNDNLSLKLGLSYRFGN